MKEINISQTRNGYLYSCFFVNYIFKLIGYKVCIKEGCDIVVHYCKILPENIDTLYPEKKYIIWNPETCAKNADLLNLKSEYILFSSTDKCAHINIPYAFHAYLEYKERNIWLKYKDFKEKSKVLGYCISNSKPEANHRIDFINTFDKYCKDHHSFGKWRHKNSQHKEMKGNWNNENLHKKYSQCKFVFALENRINENGYLTEKIINAFTSGSIPIYGGDYEHAIRYFNPKRFICVNNFPTYDDCVKHIMDIVNDDTKYKSIVNEPIFIPGTIFTDYDNENFSIVNDIKTIMKSIL